MRWFISLVLFLVGTMSLQADTFVYVSLAMEQKIQIYRLNAEDGQLTAVEAVDVDGAPGSLAMDPQKKFLFASLRTTNSLASFAVDAKTGKIKLLSSAPLGKGENAAFVSTDRTGKWLFSASYAGGKVVVHRLGEDGKIQKPAVQTVTTVKTAHSTVVDRDNRWVFVPHVAPNAVYQLRLDPATGKLMESGQAPGGTKKAGPRHLAFHPTLDLAFTSDEEGSSITAYLFHPENGLTPVQTFSTPPVNFQGKNTTAEVKVHPSGKFVWVSNRGHDSLAGFAIDAQGKLSPLEKTATEKTPRSFDITPDGNFLLAAGEGTGKLAIYRVDLKSGQLTRIHTQDVGKSLTWVMAIDLGK
jgi:6-phosphogluconolactonase